MFLVTTSLSCLLTADGQILVVKIKIFPVKLEKYLTCIAYLVQNVQELLGQAEEETGKKHGLNVRDEFRLPHQPVQPSTLLQALRLHTV